MSELEDDKSTLQTWNEISNSTECADLYASISGEEVKESFSDEEMLEQCIEDPLTNNPDNMKVTEFQFQYAEADLIEELSEEEEGGQPQNTSVTATTRGKRSKICNEFKSKNGRVWSREKFPPYQKTVSTSMDSNCLQLVPEGKGPATSVTNALEAWYLLLDERIMVQILTHTNEKILSLRSKLSYQRRTDLVELRAWLGLNYLCGIFRNSAQPGPLAELWTWELGNSIFRATMSWKRFEFLASCICFGPPVKEKQPLQNVLLIKDVLERFLANCRSYYSPSGNCVIDDWVIDINDKNFDDTTDNQNARLTVICDAKTLYCCNALFSNLTEPPETRERIVLHLIADLKGSQRNIVLPAEYTSGAIAQKMMQRNLTLVGALSEDSADVPIKALADKDAKRKLYSDIGCLIINSAETVSASAHLLTNGLTGKVSIERLFHCTKRSWDRFGQVVGAFSTKNATCETIQNGPLAIFHTIMDFAALNAWILLRLSISGKRSAPTQREFQRDLGLYLTQMQLKRQLQAKNKLTLPQKLQISEVLGEPVEKLLTSACEIAKKNAAQGFLPTSKLELPEGHVLMSRNLERRQRCCICVKYQTRTRCQQCLRALCQRHLIVRCNDCMGLKEVPDA